MTDRILPPCAHLRSAVDAIRDCAGGGAETVELSRQEAGDLWLYVSRLQDAVLAADKPWPFPAPGVHFSPRSVIEKAAAEVRGFEDE